jgi:chaperonin cofactor prefoldin
MKNLIKFLITCYKSLGFLLSNPIFKVLRLSWYFLFSLYLYFNYFEYLNATCEVIVSNSSFFNQYYALSLLGIDDVGIIASLEGVFEFQQSVSFLFIIILVITIVLCHHFSWKVVLSFLGIVGGSIYKAYCNFLDNQELLLHFPIFDFKIYRRWDDSEKLNFICEALNSLNYSIDTIDINALLLYLNSNNIIRKDAIISSTMEWVNSNYNDKTDPDPSDFNDTIDKVDDTFDTVAIYVAWGTIIAAGLYIAGAVLYTILKPILFGGGSAPAPAEVEQLFGGGSAPALPALSEDEHIKNISESLTYLSDAVEKLHELSDTVGVKAFRVNDTLESMETKVDYCVEALSVKVATVDSKTALVRLELKELDAKVVHMDAKVDALASKVNAVDTRVNVVDAEVINVGTKVDALDAKVTNVDTKVNALDAKVDALDAKVDTRLDAIYNLLMNYINNS